MIIWLVVSYILLQILAWRIGRYFGLKAAGRDIQKMNDEIAGNTHQVWNIKTHKWEHD